MAEVLRLPSLYAIVDADSAAACGWTVPALAEAYLEGGARLLQVRAKHLTAAAYLDICLEVVAVARSYCATVIVNDRADVAVLAGAQGVHVGQDDLDVESIRHSFPALALVGLSTHTREQVEAARLVPASYVAVGPVFGTSTKDTGFGPVGLDLVRYAASGAGLGRPVVAIGGITIGRARSVIEAGAAAVAVISDLLAGGRPAERVREYVRVLGSQDV